MGRLDFLPSNFLNDVLDESGTLAELSLGAGNAWLVLASLDDLQIQHVSPSVRKQMLQELRLNFCL